MRWSGLQFDMGILELGTFLLHKRCIIPGAGSATGDMITQAISRRAISRYVHNCPSLSE
jgi:hypothetical protein